MSIRQLWESSGTQSSSSRVPEVDARCSSVVEAILACGPPVFISGCNRGGTSILSQLLGEHPDLFNVGQGRLFEGNHLWSQKFPDTSRHRWALEPWRSSMRKTGDDATPEMVEFFRESFASAVDGRGRILEKTPANALRIPFIDACFPNACFLHVIRDGRDTVCSLMARHVPLEQAPHQWVGVHSTALADLETIPAARKMTVRYESILANPMSVLEAICRHCGLSLDDDACWSLQQAVHRALRDPLSRWPRLPLQQRRFILDVIHDTQVRLGYPAEV